MLLKMRSKRKKNKQTNKQRKRLKYYLTRIKIIITNLSALGLQLKCIQHKMGGRYSKDLQVYVLFELLPKRIKLNQIQWCWCSPSNWTKIKTNQPKTKIKVQDFDQKTVFKS